MDEPRPVPSPTLPPAVHRTLDCVVCQTGIEYLCVTTPEGIPDFIQVVDIQAWLGWHWSDADEAVALIGTCSTECLHEHWKNLTEPGA
jgi:hypothetical protein